MDSPKRHTEADVIVVGAGAAGTFAARELQKAHMDVIVLEARNRIGGRIFTKHNSKLRAPMPLELGAEFVHGDDVVTWDYIKEFGLHTVEFPASGGQMYTDDGECMPDANPQHIMEALQAEAQSVLAKSKKRISVEQFLARAKVKRILESFSITDRMAIQLIRNDFSADPSEMDLSSLLESQVTGYHKSYRIVEGYGALIEHAAQELDIRKNQEVQQIEWSPGSVLVKTQCHSFRSRYGVITLPTGVLQAGDVKFSPHLPEDTTNALHALTPGQVMKMIMQFRRNRMNRDFWDREKPWLMKEALQLYWSPEWGSSGEGQRFFVNNLTAGTAVDQFDHYEEKHRLPIIQLAKTYQRPSEHLLRYFEHSLFRRWDQDRFAKSGYSAIGIHGDASARQTLQKPIEDTLFFAGEHTATKGPGFVHGAIESGLRVAEQIKEISSTYPEPASPF